MLKKLRWSMTTHYWVVVCVLLAAGCVPELKNFDGSRNAGGRQMLTPQDSGLADAHQAAHTPEKENDASPMNRAVGADGSTGIDASASIRDAGVGTDQGNPSQSDSSVDDTLADASIECVPSFIDTSPSLKPVDMVWVVGSSLSMRKHIEKLQEQMVGLVENLAQANVDYRIILISADQGKSVEGATYVGVCLPAPISGQDTCPDVNSERFFHIRSPVYRTDSLAVLKSTAPEWGGLLRDDARVHLFVVSDNDHNVAVTRQELVGAGLPMDFMAHCIVDTLGTINDPMICGEGDVVQCGCGDAMGRVYMTLSELTNGLALNICTVDWAPLINEVSTKLVEASTRECTYDIPMRSDENQIDPELLNVTLVESNGEFRPLGRTGNCATNPVAWTLISIEPTLRIRLCPDSCAIDAVRVRADVGCQRRAD